MKKLLLSTLVACACFGAGLDAKVKGYIDYIAQNACGDKKLKELDEICSQIGGPICGQLHTTECSFNLNMEDDKTVKKLAAVIKKELKNRTETFGEIFKIRKAKRY